MEKAKKVYTFQNKEFTMKKINLKIRNEMNFLVRDFKIFNNKFNEDIIEKIDALEEEGKEKTKKYQKLQTELSNQTGLAIISFFTDEDKLKELFEKILDGNIEINYDVEEDQDYIAIIQFASTIFTDFFKHLKLEVITKK